VAPSPPGLLLNLQLLRAIAALAVVYFHCTSEAGLNLPVSVGAHGVDVFFVISGFIISYIGARTPDQFLMRRVIRIVPFYWTATLAVFAAAWAAPHLLRSTRPDVVQLLCSLFFIPRETSYAGLVPTLVLGWSLNYEMYFYAVFALALACVPRRAPLICGAAIAAIAIMASGAAHPSVRFYGRPIVFEFALGIAVFHVFAAADRRAGWLGARPWIRPVLLAAASGALLLIGIEEYCGGFGLPRFVAAGVPAFVLVAAALLLERIYGVKASSRLVALLGESSYVLYLIHPYVIYGLLRTVVRPPADLALPAAIGLAVVLALAAAAVAAAIHLWIERPAIAALRRRLLRFKDLRPRRAHGPGAATDFAVYQHL
jgi:exopolysaccharide production protein ExoZ